MNDQSLDRVARALGGAASRRAAVRGALAALAGLAAERAAAAGSGSRASRAPRPEGPCGDRGKAANACRKDRQCCTGICDTRKASRRKDGKGRCVCRKAGRPCAQDRNCCNGRQCVAGVCGGTAPAVPTGQPCVAGNRCADPNATCVAYQHDPNGGSFCLLPRKALCAASGDCASGRCRRGNCAPCTPAACGVACSTPDVCATCNHTTVQAAIDAATAGDIITIGAGTWSEDLAVSKNLTLRGCLSDRVILRNATYDTRTITVSGGAKLTVMDLIIDGYNDLPTNKGGGITTDGDLLIGGAAVIRNSAAPNGGAVSSSAAGVTIAITDEAVLLGNVATGEGGALRSSGSGATVALSMQASLLRNRTDSYGGGMTVVDGHLTITDDVVIDGNSTGDTFGGGGGIQFYRSSTYTQPMSGSIDGNVVFSNNYANQFGGGIIISNRDANSFEFTIGGNARFTGNQALYGGGIDVWMLPVTITDDVRIDGNSSVGGSGGGIFVEPMTQAWPAGWAPVTISGNVVIEDNVAPDGAGVVISATPALLAGSASIRDNTATGNGGGVLLKYKVSDSFAATLAVTGSASIAGNRAASGGGVYSDNAANTLNAVAGSITGNTPDNCAGQGISCP